MPFVAFNARVLTAEGSTRARERLAEYLPPEALAAALAASDAACVAVDRPGAGAGAFARALESAGAFAAANAERLVISGTRSAFIIAAAQLEGTARALADEVLRALDADRQKPSLLRLRERTLDLASGAKVMGILNVTPDSFFDGGKYAAVERALERARSMAELGAAVIDVGGQSYASWNPRIAAEEESARVVPVIRALVRAGLDVPLSVDTFKSEVAEAALDAGAHLINDCSGLSDERLARVVARYAAGLVVMHLKGQLNVRAAEYRYDDPLGEIVDALRQKTERALAEGVARDALVVDPGLEFGKEPATDLEILQRFGDLRSLGYPILVAASRKSFIGSIFERPAEELLVPSLATAAVAIAAGARIVRAHDIGESVQLCSMLRAIETRRALAGPRAGTTA